MAVSGTDVTEHLRLLHNTNINIVNEAASALKDSLNAGEGWPLIVEFYCNTRSGKALDLIAGVREPNDKLLLDKLTECIRTYGVEVVTILNHVLIKQPSWLPRLTQHSVFPSIIKLVKDCIQHIDQTCSVYMHVVNGLLFLSNLLPHMALLTQSQLSDMLSLLFKTSELLLNQSRDPVASPPTNNIQMLSSLLKPVYMEHLRLSITIYFQRLYGIFPCNTMHYIKSHQFDKKNIAKEIIKPLLLKVRFHPFLLTMTRDTELSRERWVGKEAQDILHLCASVIIDNQAIDSSGFCFCGGVGKSQPSIHESLNSRLSILLDSVNPSPNKSAQVSPLKPLPRFPVSSTRGNEQNGWIRPAPIRLPSEQVNMPNSLTVDRKPTNGSNGFFWSPSMSISLETPPQSRRETPVHAGASITRRDSMRSHASAQSQQERRSLSSVETPSYRQRKSFGQAMAKIFRPAASEVPHIETEEDKTEAMCKAIIEMATNGSVPSSPLQTVNENSQHFFECEEYQTPFVHGRQASQVSQAEEALEATDSCSNPKNNEPGRMSLAQLETVSEMLRSESAANGTEDSEVQSLNFNRDKEAAFNRTASQSSIVRSRHTSGTLRGSGRNTAGDTNSRKSSCTPKRDSRSEIRKLDKTPKVVFTLTEQLSPLDGYLRTYNLNRFNRIRVQSECPDGGVESSLNACKKTSIAGQTPVRKRSLSCPRNLGSEANFAEVFDEIANAETEITTENAVPSILMGHPGAPGPVQMNQLFPYANILAKLTNIQRQTSPLISTVAPSIDDAYSSDKAAEISPACDSEQSDNMEMYLEASRRVYDCSMAGSGSGSLGKFGKSSSDLVLSGLRAQLAMCHQQILFERYQKILHAQRNRSLFGRLKRSLGGEEELKNTKEKMLFWDRTREEMLKVIHSLYHQKKKLVEDVKDQMYKNSLAVKEHVQEQHELLQQLKVERTEKVDIESDNESLREQMKLIQKELFQLQAQFEEGVEEREERDHLRTRVTDLERQLLTASEMQGALLLSSEEKLNALCQCQTQFDLAQANLESLRKEMTDMRRQLRKERGKCDTWSSKAMDMESQVKRSWQQMHDYQQQIKEMRSVHAAHVKALNVKQQTLLNVCQRLEVYIGELNAVIEGNTVNQHSSSHAINVSIPNRPGSKEIVSYGSSLGDIAHSFSSGDRPLSSLARSNPRPQLIDQGQLSESEKE